MPRTTRVAALVAFRLLLGVPGAAVFAAVTAAALVGCSDDTQPEYWVKKLDEPASRPTAIKRLTQFFEDAMTKSNSNRDAPDVKALLGKIVAPMTKAYVSGDLDEKTRVDLLKALANTRDPGAKDAIIKAIGDFAAGKATAEEMKQSALYVKQLKLKEAAGPLLEAFLKTKASDPKQGSAFKETHDAMVAIADPLWKGKLLDLLNRPIDRKDAPNARNEIFWQTTAADVLGEVRAPDAVRPLFKVVESSDKLEVQPSAVVALVKIGKPAVAPLVEVLNGKDDELVKYGKQQAGSDAAKANAYVTNAAIVLGTIGRGEALGPLTSALAKANDDLTKTVVARELTKLPATPESIKAFKTAFDAIDASALLPPGGDFGRAALADAASGFMDASMLPWFVGEIRGAKGSAEEKDAAQASLLQTAIKVMKKDQVDQVKPMIDAEGGDVEKRAFKQAADVLNACGETLGCYLAKLEDPASQEKNLEMTSVKAAYMLGMLGSDGDSTKGEIVNRLPKIKNTDVRVAAIKAIVHLSPKGDAKIADQLQKLIDEDAARGGGAAGDAYIRQTIPQLRARAES